MADASPTSMSAAAQQYQDAIHKYQPRRESKTQPPEAQPKTEPTADTTMGQPQNQEQKQEQEPQQEQYQTMKQSPAPPTIPPPLSTQSPAPFRQQGTPTPTRNTNGALDTSSRTPLNNNSSSTEAAASVPIRAVEHGAPFRRYLNTKVTPTLLEGMKQLALEQPKDPLKYLGDYLLQRSNELEGT
ncbi:MAG: hypothetical protein M1837_002491 [Sclerophora amabilis]|nr:MAG: hypothetical protein M1837_002491 [Sclerophora amabilis]